MKLFPFLQLDRYSSHFINRLKSVINFPCDNLWHRFEMRILLYLAHGLMVNGATFLSFIVYEKFIGDEIWLPFQGMYALHTSLNFTICFILVMETWQFLKKNVSTYRMIMGHIWALSCLSLVLGYLLQRSLVYSATGSYYPELIEFHRMYPYTRPRFFYMFGWFFLSWLPFINLLSLITYWLERKQRSTRPTVLMSEAEESQSMSPFFLQRDGLDCNIKYKDITHISMEDHYARIFWRDDEKINETLIRSTLKEMHEELPEDQFLQIHRSHLVNLTHIGGLIREGRKWSIPMGAVRLPVSRNKLPIVKEIISGSQGGT